MKLRTLQTIVALATVLIVLFADQAIKIAVKTSMYLHESIRITDWFYILFTENPGMAFGWEFGPKIILSLFRIIAVIAIAYYMVQLVRRGVAKTGYVFCLALVLSGAAGNIFDCLFYGMIFNSPVPPMVAEFVPWGSGYDSLMMGKVVDMFYFPIIDIENMPSWVPFYGGKHFVFFSPIFNFADSAISCGIVAMLLFYRKPLVQALGEKKDDENA